MKFSDRILSLILEPYLLGIDEVQFFNEGIIGWRRPCDSSGIRYGLYRPAFRPDFPTDNDRRVCDQKEEVYEPLIRNAFVR